MTVEMYSQLPGSRPTTDALERLKSFLQEEVDVKASLMRAMSSKYELGILLTLCIIEDNHPQTTENVELKSPPKSSKSPTVIESPFNFELKASTLSSKYLIYKKWDIHFF